MKKNKEDDTLKAIHGHAEVGPESTPLVNPPHWKPSIGLKSIRRLQQFRNPNKYYQLYIRLKTRSSVFTNANRPQINAMAHYMKIFFGTQNKIRC